MDDSRMHGVRKHSPHLVARVQMRKWKKWESETNSLEYQYANGN